MVGAVRTTKPATQNDLPAPSGHHHCPQESTFCAPQPHARPLGHLLAITKSLAAQPLEAPCKQTTPRRARFDSAPKRQVICKGSAQGTGCLLGRGSRDKPNEFIIEAMAHLVDLDQTTSSPQREASLAHLDLQEGNDFTWFSVGGALGSPPQPAPHALCEPARTSSGSES